MSLQIRISNPVERYRAIQLQRSLLHPKTKDTKSDE